MAPKYILSYFNVKALAEPIRLLLAHANIEFIDNRVEQISWSTLKEVTPWGKLPILVDGDFKLSQSTAILKYLAKRHGYYGNNDQEAAKIDECVGAIRDLLDVLVPYVEEKSPEKKEEMRMKLAAEHFPFYLDRFNKVLEQNGTYLVGDKFSYADFVVAANVQTVKIYVPELLDKYPAVKAHQKTVFESPGIRKWVARRPITHI